MSKYKPFKSFVKSHFPGAVTAYHNARQALTSGSLETIFTEIHRTNAWQDPESVSGRGSTLARTKIIMSQLPLLLQELQAETLLDAACGDLNWMRYVDLGKVKYTGVDVVPDLIQRNRTLYGEIGTFALLDITSDELPQSDVILCRDCFIHLSYRSIRAALKNFKKTHAKYLLCTTHTTVGENIDCPDGSWRSVNVQLAPLNFPAPVKLIVEDAELGKCLGVWRMADL